MQTPRSWQSGSWHKNKPSVPCHPRMADLQKSPAVRGFFAVKGPASLATAEPAAPLQLLCQLLQYRWVFQSAGVLGNGFAFGNRAQQTAHDFAATGFG